MKNRRSLASPVPFLLSLAPALAATADAQAVGQEAYLKSPFPGFADALGRSVALDGDTLVVGVPDEDGGSAGVGGDPSDDSVSRSGAAYVFVRSGTSWTLQAYLKASNPGVWDEFGTAVALDGDTLVVGAEYEDSGASGIDGDQSNDSVGQAGAAYVFVRNGSTWSQQAYLKASNPDFEDRFGRAVAVHGDTVVVGATSESSAATGVDGDQTDDSAPVAGAAYVFVRSGTTWTQQAYLKASNAGQVDQFGMAVSLDGDTLVVGAIGDDSGATGVNGDQLDDSAPASGAAYVFTRSGTSWSQQAYLKASVVDEGDRFGGSLDLDGDTLVVGAASERSAATGVDGDANDDSAVYAGAAYVFTRSGSSWSQQAYLKATNTAAYSGFGVDVGVSGDRVIVGAPAEDGASTGVDGDQFAFTAVDAGAAYLYERVGGSWTPTKYLKASNTDAEDAFGVRVALDGTTAVCTAPDEASASPGDPSDDSLEGAGAAYVFDLDGPVASATVRTAGANVTSYAATSPVLGRTWEGTVDLTTTGHAAALVVGYATPANVPLASGEVLLVGAAFPAGELLGLAPALGPLATFEIPIPQDAALLGTTAFTQAVHFAGVQPFAVANAVDLVIGY